MREEMQEALDSADDMHRRIYSETSLPRDFHEAKEISPGVVVSIFHLERLPYDHIMSKPLSPSLLYYFTSLRNWRQ
ncbi:hypothetical protein KW805_01815 [Candidatus Pacearchaeota archaeon]|nr:hypothetical protein [Candidatus Pacearchaeota archaeon]